MSHREIPKKSWPGYLMLVILLALTVIFGWVAISSFVDYDSLIGLVAVGGMVVSVFFWFGFVLVQPNEARVLQLFGKYVGTVRESGLRWLNPLYTSKSVSQKIRNFESGQLKVNDLGGSPIEIACIVVWRVVDTAEAVFEVDHYEEFVRIQSEAALRNLATTFPYDNGKQGELTLRSDPNTIASHLRQEIQDRLQKAGVEVVEARISHLAYAQEIASAMLRRQQASAVVAARAEIVAGAVGMVRMALDQLESDGMVTLDEERKANMVSNLLVVLCGEQQAQPVVNAGSLY